MTLVKEEKEGSRDILDCISYICNLIVSFLLVSNISPWWTTNSVYRYLNSELGTGCLNTYINTEFSYSEISLNHLSVFTRSVSLFKNILLQCVKIASLPITEVRVNCFKSSSTKFPRNVFVIWFRRPLELHISRCLACQPTLGWPSLMTWDAGPIKPFISARQIGWHTRLSWRLLFFFPHCDSDPLPIFLWAPVL